MPKVTEQVLVAGCGLISPFGGLEATAEAMRAGLKVTGVPLELLSDTAWADRLAGPEPSPELPPLPKWLKMRKYMSIQSLLAVVAAHEAIIGSGPVFGDCQPSKVGLFVGVGLASVDPLTGMDILESAMGPGGVFAYNLLIQKGLAKLNPMWVFETLANMPAAIISILEGIKGESAIYTPFEDGSSQALFEAASALAGGLVDLAVVVAADVPSRPSNLSLLSSLGYLTSGETATSSAAALVLALPGPGLGGGGRTGLGGFELSRVLPGEAAYDPLAPWLGRTMATAPIMLAALSAAAPDLGLDTSIVGSEGHRLSFQVVTD
jgi:3-oxoacyl-(acyl-carrier-protein) synthase